MKYKKWVSIGQFLFKHMWLYFILAHTWGLLWTVVGYLVSFIFIISGYKPISYNHIYYFEIGHYWGGLEFGTCFIRDDTSSDVVTKHEFGHTVQNCILGPLFVFLVVIPSASRYWYQTIAMKHGKKFTADWYDSVWFEGSATEIGTYIRKEN